MPKSEEAVRLLREGLPPSEIAARLNTSAADVMRHLCLKVGEGDLRRSDIVFSIDSGLRHAIEEIIAAQNGASIRLVATELRRRGFDANRLDVRIYLRYRRARVVLGDLYELVRNIEVRLHRFIKEAFIQEYGEDGWWRGGIPDRIRADCAAVRERDQDPADDAYCYTTLINLREILDKQWNVLGPRLPKRIQSDKKEFLDALKRLNGIRNAVMHPVRNDRFTDDDFEFVRSLEHQLGELRVQPRTPESPLQPEQPTAEPERPKASVPQEQQKSSAPEDQKHPKSSAPPDQPKAA
jgi:hypothetical protein